MNTIKWLTTCLYLKEDISWFILFYLLHSLLNVSITMTNTNTCISIENYRTNDCVCVYILLIVELSKYMHLSLKKHLPVWFNISYLTLLVRPKNVSSLFCSFLELIIFEIPPPLPPLFCLNICGYLSIILRTNVFTICLDAFHTELICSQFRTVQLTVDAPASMGPESMLCYDSEWQQCKKLSCGEL